MKIMLSNVYSFQQHLNVLSCKKRQGKGYPSKQSSRLCKFETLLSDPVTDRLSSTECKATSEARNNWKCHLNAGSVPWEVCSDAKVCKRVQMKKTTRRVSRQRSIVGLTQTTSSKIQPIDWLSVHINASHHWEVAKKWGKEKKSSTSWRYLYCPD